MTHAIIFCAQLVSYLVSLLSRLVDLRPRRRFTAYNIHIRYSGHDQNVDFDHNFTASLAKNDV